MTRCLRQTMYPPPGVGTPISAVIIEKDLKVSLEELIASMPAQDSLVVNDIFEMPDRAEIVSVGIEGERRRQQNEEAEKHMQTLYYWLAMYMLRGWGRGAIVMPKTAPLTAEQMKGPLEQLGRHSAYTGQTIIGYSSDGKLVKLDNGKVAILPMPSA